MEFRTEVQTKLERVRALMAQHRVGALWLRTVNNFAWITGGVDPAVNTASSEGIASVVITEDSATVWTNSIEAPRLTPLFDLEVSLVIAVQKLRARLAVGPLEDQFNGAGAVPLHVDDGHALPRQNTADLGAGLELF